VLARYARSFRWSLIAFGLVVGVSFCRRVERRPPAGVVPTSDAPPEPSKTRPPPLAGERVEIPAGAFSAGSLPGEPGRNPEVEPSLYQVELGPFQIDKLPYPNDPARPPLIGAARREAEKLCAERGQRLCTELEWERACKGPASDMFAGSAVWDPRCGREPTSCASGFEVLAMGGALREWTASDLGPTDPASSRRSVLRGAAAAARAAEHRCAERRAIEPNAATDDVGFRCCKGAPNAAVVAEPKLGPAFRKMKLSAERLEKLLRSDPKTDRLAKAVKFFRDPDAAEAVVARGPGDRKGFLFTVAPLLWNPAAGSQCLVVAARSGETTAFVLAYWVLGEDDFRLASSFILENESGPVALAYSDSIRPRLHFSTCWGCPGETGRVLFRSPESVAIVEP
jgi:hypothetical protein